MYPVLHGLMMSRGYTVRTIAEELGIPLSTMYIKFKGKTDFKLEEAIKIKELLASNMPLEELFER